MEDERRLIGILEEQLLENVENDCNNQEGCETGGDNDRGGRVGSEVANRLGDSSENTHTARRRTAEA